MQAANETQSSALPKLLLYLTAVMVGGALLAPGLFHLGKNSPEIIGNSFLGQTGFGTWLIDVTQRAHFTRYFNRAILVCALAFIWPFLRWVKIDRSLLPTWKPFSTGIKQWTLGFLLAAGLLMLLGFVFLQMGAYKLRGKPQWLDFGPAISAALGAGIIEEFFFRGLLLGLFLRTMSTGRAIFAGTFVFAIVHFLKPPTGWQLEDAEVTWSSGFLVLQQIGAGFGDVNFLLAEFATLFAVGWVLAQMRMKTGALWASIGLHGGWIFGLKYYSTLAASQPDWLPWIGSNLKIGLMPLVVVLLTGWISFKLIPTNHLQVRSPEGK
jgi:membrane protease YdiL (CAAX protease family)